MEPDDAARRFVNEVRRNILRDVRTSHHYLTTGKPELLRDPQTGEPARNPFTGEPMLLTPLPEVRHLGELLQKRGLTKDTKLMDALRAALLHHAAAPMFNLFSTLDGEGAFEDPDLQLELRVVNGEPLPGHLHDIFYPIEER